MTPGRSDGGDTEMDTDCGGKRTLSRVWAEGPPRCPPTSQRYTAPLSFGVTTICSSRETTAPPDCGVPSLTGRPSLVQTRRGAGCPPRAWHSSRTRAPTRKVALGGGPSSHTSCGGCVTPSRTLALRLPSPGLSASHSSALPWSRRCPISVTLDIETEPPPSAGVTAVSPWGSSRPPSHQRSRTGGLLGALLHARLSVPFSATVGDPKIVTSAGR